MPFVGDKGSASYPTIRRVDLISGEQWQREGRGYKRPSPAGAAGIGVHKTSSGSPPAWNDKLAEYAIKGRHWTDEIVRTPIDVWNGRGMLDLSGGPNKYGFMSRSEMMYPELYRPIDTKFWQPLTREERSELVARAAAANTKATFDDEVYRPVAATSADEQYLEAQSRRAESIRRRKKPRNYDDRKKEEELKRKEPLVRKYSGPVENFFRSSTAIVKVGPIDTPILVSGLPVFGRNNSDPRPLKLRAKKPRQRKPDDHQLTAYDQEGQLVAPTGELPTFSPLAGKKTKLITTTNNPWGLKSWSEMLYPEAYRDLSNVYWKQLSNEDRQRIMAVQARAMEKVGYEPGTAKLFIDPIEGYDDYRVRSGGRTDDTAGRRSGGGGEAFIGVVILLALLAALLWAGGSVLGDSAGNAAVDKAGSPEGGD
jgi:hypothetical protein